MKRIRQWQLALTPKTPVQQWLFFLLACLVTGFVWTVMSFWVQLQSPRMALQVWLTGRFWYTVLLFFAATALFSLAFRSIFAGGAVWGLIVLGFGLVNYYKIAITGSPFLFHDLTLAGNLGGIVALNARSLMPNSYCIIALLGFAAYLVILKFFSPALKPASWKWTALTALAPLTALILVFWVFLDPLVLRPLNSSLELGQMSQFAVNDRCGFPIGLLRGAKLSLRPVATVGNDYLTPMVAELKAELGEAEAPSEQKPNIILVLSESFSDVTKLSGVTFSNDPIREFHDLQKESVSGTFYTRTLGYGTANIELEVLTGINTHLMGNESLCTMPTDQVAAFPAVPQLLSDAGYRTAMLHTFSDDIYHRGPIMKAIGFQETYFSGDFAAIDPGAKAADDYYDYLGGKLSGGFYSDDYMADLLIQLTEDTNDKPLFAYAISMENHTPYDRAKYAEDEFDFTMDSPLTGDAQVALAAYSQGCANASKALGKLVDFLRDFDEPTILIFYGDHRPGLGLEGTNSVYSELWKALGKPWDPQDPDIVRELYSTKFLIWANDPSLLPGEAGDDSLVDSSNYFGLNILNAAGVKKPLYWRALEQLKETRIIDTVGYSLGRDGSYEIATPTQGEDGRRLSRLAAFTRDVFYGGKFATKALWD